MVLFLFYIGFVISTLIFGSVFIGPMSIRVYMTVLMILFLLLKFSYVLKQLPKTYILLYVMFMLFVGVATAFNGDMTLGEYLKVVLSTFLVSIVAYYATGYFINNSRKLYIIYWALILVLLFTSVITILQYIGIPIGWIVGEFFAQADQDVIDKIENVSDLQENLLGVSFARGVFNHPVKNAMFIASISVLPLGGLINANNNVLIRTLYTAIYIIATVACFMTQQRSAFYILVAVSVAIVFCATRRKMLLLLVCGMIFWAELPIIYDYISSDAVGRLSVLNLTDGTGRNVLWYNARNFIYENILFGGPVKFMQMNNGLPPHNFFYSAFIYGGLFGGIIIICLFIKIIVYLVSKMKSNLCKSNYTGILSASLFVFLVQGFFHNGSLVEGEVIILLLLSLILVSEKLKCRSL